MNDYIGHENSGRYQRHYLKCQRLHIMRLVSEILLCPVKLSILEYT
jgi:hypothetical protein